MLQIGDGRGFWKATAEAGEAAGTVTGSRRAARTKPVVAEAPNAAMSFARSFMSAIRIRGSLGAQSRPHRQAYCAQIRSASAVLRRLARSCSVVRQHRIPLT